MATVLSAPRACALASLFLVVGSGFAADQVTVIPDAPRVWTHRDGRSVSLRLVESSPDTVKLWNPVSHKFHDLSIAELSDDDQQYLKSIGRDGSRLWTNKEGKARRLRLTQFDGTKVIFEVPDAGYSEVQLEELCSADQERLLQLQAFERSLNFPSSRVLATVLVALLQAPMDAQAGLPTAAAVQAELNSALASKDLKTVLDKIGTGASATVTVNGNAYEAAIRFQRLLVQEETAVQLMAAFDTAQASVVKGRVTQNLNLTEAQANLVTLSFKLATVPPPWPPKQPGTTVTTPGLGTGNGGATKGTCCQPVYYTPCCVPKCCPPRFARRCRCW